MMNNLVLAMMGAHLANASKTTLEWSLFLDEDGAADRQRVTCWISPAMDASFTPITKLLEECTVPRVVLDTQMRVAPLSLAQAFSVSAGPDQTDYRLYLHHRRQGGGSNLYDAFRWKDASRVETASYECYYLPESPSGIKPMDVVHPRLESFLCALLANERLQMTGTFWLRRREGEIDQLDLVWVWHPPLAELRAQLFDLCTVLEISADWISSHEHHHLRHIALSCRVASKPSVTIYFSAPATTWPANYDELKNQVQVNGKALHDNIVRGFLDQSPHAPAVAHHDLDAFYSTNQVDVWQQVLGPRMHYHHGIFTNGQSLASAEIGGDEAFDRAVHELYHLIPASGTVYDIGCGWGGPATLLSRDHGCQVVGLTISRTQYQYCASLGLMVRYGNAEATIPPGYFDCMLLLESFEHISDKLRLLKMLRLFGKRLVMRVNCQDSLPESVNFADTMHMVSSENLRDLIERAGWRIIHWQNRRQEAMPTIRVWHERLQNIAPSNDLHLETFRCWTARVLDCAKQWAACNPLIEVAAE